MARRAASREDERLARKTRAKAARIEAALEKELLTPFDGDAHMYLMSVYKNQRLSTETRLEAAKAALPYEKPRLAALTVGTAAGDYSDRVITLNFVGATEQPEMKVVEQVDDEPRKKLRFVS